MLFESITSFRHRMEPLGWTFMEQDNVANDKTLSLADLHEYILQLRDLAVVVENDKYRYPLDTMTIKADLPKDDDVTPELLERWTRRMTQFQIILRELETNFHDDFDCR